MNRRMSIMMRRRTRTRKLSLLVMVTGGAGIRDSITNEEEEEAAL